MLKTIFLSSLLIACPLRAATISISPSNQIVPTGGTVGIGVLIQDVLDLYAFQFDVRYDPSVLSFTSASEGDFLLSGGGFFPGINDPGIGVIALTIDSLTGFVAGRDGSGILARFEFAATSLGTSSIRLENVLLLNSSLSDISASLSGGNVTISSAAVPEPNSGLVLLSCLGSLLIFRRFSKYRGTENSQ